MGYSLPGSGHKLFWEETKDSGWTVLLFQKSDCWNPKYPVQSIHGKSWPFATKIQQREEAAKTLKPACLPWLCSEPGCFSKNDRAHGLSWASQVLLVIKNLPAKARDIRDAGSIPGLGRTPRGGHGNPLQYSCLENPMDRGAWRASGLQKELATTIAT